MGGILVLTVKETLVAPWFLSCSDSCTLANRPVPVILESNESDLKQDCKQQNDHEKTARGGNTVRLDPFPNLEPFKYRAHLITPLRIGETPGSFLERTVKFDRMKPWGSHSKATDLLDRPNR
mgnify:CR=1 FL=1